MKNIINKMNIEKSDLWILCLLTSLCLLHHPKILATTDTLELDKSEPKHFKTKNPNQTLPKLPLTAINTIFSFLNPGLQNSAHSIIALLKARNRALHHTLIQQNKNFWVIARQAHILVADPDLAQIMENPIFEEFRHTTVDSKPIPMQNLSHDYFYLLKTKSRSYRQKVLPKNQFSLCVIKSSKKIINGLTKSSIKEVRIIDFEEPNTSLKICHKTSIDDGFARFAVNARPETMDNYTFYQITQTDGLLAKELIQFYRGNFKGPCTLRPEHRSILRRYFSYFLSASCQSTLFNDSKMNITLPDPLTPL